MLREWVMDGGIRGLSGDDNHSYNSFGIIWSPLLLFLKGAGR